MRLIHFTGLENYLDCSKFENIVLGPNINNNYTDQIKNILSYQIIGKNKYKIEKVIELRKTLIQLTKELNSYNKKATSQRKIGNFIIYASFH